MVANLVGFGFGFGFFIVAFVVLAVSVIRFAGRVGRRTADRDLPPRDRSGGPGGKEGD